MQRPSRGSFSAADRALLAGAVLALSAALQINNGFFDSSALLLVVVSAVLAIAGLAGVPNALRGTWLNTEIAVAAVLVAALAWSFIQLWTASPGIDLETPFPPAPPLFLALVMSAAVATAVVASAAARVRGGAFALALAAFAGLGVWMLRAAPHPTIDVVSVFNAGITALHRGRSPYHVTFFNVYTSPSLYPKGTIIGRQGDVVFGFPYPPLALLMAYPGRYLHDFRLAELAALIAGAAAIGASGRSRTAPLAACALVFMPRSLFMLEEGWSEPLTICWLGVMVWMATRRRRAGIPLGLLIASKQHLALALLFARSVSRDAAATRRTIVTACAVGALVTVPFVLWDARGVWDFVVTLQFRESFRTDSLSVLPWLAFRGLAPRDSLLMLPTVAALLVGILLAWRTAPRTPAGLAAALGVIFVLTFAFSKKAFCNYYYLVIACWCAAIAASDGEDPDAARVDAAVSVLPGADSAGAVDNRRRPPRPYAPDPSS